MGLSAFLLIDLQNDFMPMGALPVPEGDKIVPVINLLQPRFDRLVATQDWHPPHHGSFAANHSGHKPGDKIDLNGLSQILWPVHCVQHSKGAEFVESFERKGIHKIIQKGTDPGIDSYSGFFDNAHRKSTGLENYLRSQQVTSVYIAGLATDYCVKYTVLDACQLGFEVFLVENACRGVGLGLTDIQDAISEMSVAGAKIVRL